MTQTDAILKARNELADDLKRAAEIREKGGHVDALWFSDRVNELGRYNAMLVRLGAIPA